MRSGNIRNPFGMHLVNPAKIPIPEVRGNIGNAEMEQPATRPTEGWVAFGTHRWAPTIAEAWRQRLKELSRPAAFESTSLSNTTDASNRLRSRESKASELIAGLSNFYRALNVNPHASPAYVRPYTASFGIAPGTDPVIGTNGGLAVLATATESGFRGPMVRYPIPIGLNADGSSFSNSYRGGPMREGRPFDNDDGTAVYTEVNTNKGIEVKKAIPSIQMRVEFLRAVIGWLDDQPLDQIVTDAENRAIDPSPSLPPPAAPVGALIKPRSDIDCPAPRVTSQEEARLWNLQHPNCSPVFFDPVRRVICSYRGEPLLSQAQVDQWNREHPDCPLPPITACVPPQELTTEFEMESWKALRPWCDESLIRRTNMNREEEGGSGMGLLLVMGAGAALLYFATRKGK